MKTYMYIQLTQWKPTCTYSKHNENLHVHTVNTMKTYMYIQLTQWKPTCTYSQHNENLHVHTVNGWLNGNFNTPMDNLCDVFCLTGGALLLTVY